VATVIILFPSTVFILNAPLLGLGNTLNKKLLSAILGSVPVNRFFISKYSLFISSLIIGF
jgi:hypothetical protein